MIHFLFKLILEPFYQIMIHFSFYGGTIGRMLQFVKFAMYCCPSLCFDGKCVLGASGKISPMFVLTVLNQTVTPSLPTSEVDQKQRDTIKSEG